MHVGRPIGERIRELCEHLDRLGPSGVATLNKLMPEVEKSNLGKYCSRGVGLGLLTVKRNTGIPGKTNLWAVVPNWRELVENRRTTKRPAPPVACTTRWSGVSSVFQMGANL